MRRFAPPLTALTLVGLLAGCGGSAPADASHPATPTAAAVPTENVAPTGITGAGTASTAPPAPDRPRTPSAATTPSRRPVAALTCARLANAMLGSATARYQDHADPIPLSEGRWAGEDGVTVELQDACGIGDLDGDGTADAVRAITMSTGGSGRFVGLVVWRNSAGEPVYLTNTDLGDRTPVESIAVSGRRATVVYLTRSPDAPMAVVDIRRTAVFRLSGGRLVEVSHSDAPYPG